jgi:hypothetical protein
MKGYTNTIEECDLIPGIYTKCKIQFLGRVPIDDIYIQSIDGDNVMMRIGNNSDFYSMPKSVACYLINKKCGGYGECKNIC